MTGIKTERNKGIVQKRNKNPKKWTWGELSNYYGIDRYTVRDIYYRDKEKYSK
jgi:hypothetical protein